jgi:3-dehydroquinate synthase
MKTKTAVILAAGEGKRMDILDSPKPLVKVGNKSLILWNIEQLQEAGIKKIFIVLGFRGEEIKKELMVNPLIKANLHFIWQKDSSKKGMFKSLMALEGLIKEPFFLVMADLIIEKNPYMFFDEAETNEKDDAIWALVCVRSEQHKKSGASSKVIVKGDTIEEIGRGLKAYDGFEVGVYYFKRKSSFLIKSLTGFIDSLIGKSVDIKTFDQFLKQLSHQRKLRAMFLEGSEWFDVNTPTIQMRAEIFARGLAEQPLTASKRKLIKIKNFSNFYRHKTLKTNITVKQGLIDNLDKIKIIPDEFSKAPHFILTDSIVDKFYGNKALKGFLKAGYNVKKLVVLAGEKSKNIYEYSRLADEIFSYGMNKHSFIISLGGGVINNIAGLLASTLYRGINLIHFPTTTMAQVDAAIDFKQAVNSSKGKNLLGSYYPASLIAIDPNVLKTLSLRHIKNGLAESIKHALTQDTKFLKYLNKNYKKIKNIPFLDYVIRKTIELKVPLLNGDIKDDRNEMLPQYGHSVCHAVEHLSSYDLFHGEALAIGMCVCAEVAKMVGVCDEQTVKAHYDICHKYNLPVIVPDYMIAEDVCEKMRYDKHFVGNYAHMALITRPGKVWHEKKTYGMPIEYSIVKKAIMINKNKKKEYGK